MKGTTLGGVTMASRIREIMEYTTWYSIDGRMRLIADTGLSKSEITRLLSGRCNPSYRVVLTVIDVLEKDLGIRLDPRDVFSFSGKFRKSACEAVACRGCPKCKPFTGFSWMLDEPGKQVNCPIPKSGPDSEAKGGI